MRPTSLPERNMDLNGAASANGAAGDGMPRVAGYEVRERIGKGGMGEVYVARQLALGRLVAIKFLVPEGQSDGENDLARFRREAELMAKVSHPNILSIFDSGEADGRPFLVMEYVEGGDLRRRMRPGVPMPAAEVLTIVVPVGEALVYLHRHEILHRDLKPENILLHDGKNPRVTDFGIAVLRAGAGHLTRPAEGLGTLGYVAPEQRYGLTPLDGRVDQYALAALSYELLTGQLPLGLLKPPSRLNPALGPEVDAVLLRGLAESAADRFASVRDFTSALTKALASPRPPARRSFPSWLAWASLLLPLATVGTLGLRHPARPAPPVKTVEQKIEDLKQSRANEIWIARGRPDGPAGQAASTEIWHQAVKEVDDLVSQIAYRIWESQGRPTGPAGEEVKDSNWQEAVRRAHQEWVQKKKTENKPE